MMKRDTCDLIQRLAWSIRGIGSVLVANDDNTSGRGLLNLQTVADLHVAITELATTVDREMEKLTFPLMLGALEGS